MTTNRVIKDSNQLAKLVETLARCPEVAQFDEGPDTAAASVAYCFDSLEGHFREFLDNQLPRLEAGKLSQQEVCDLLHEVGTTLGQILWHIRLPRFYRYLDEEENRASRPTELGD
jgi:hypothetical protein